MTQVSLGNSQFSYRSSAVSTFMRGINKASQFKSGDSSIIDLADSSAQNKENKTGLTVALEDFSAKFTSFHGQNTSNINSNDCKKSFFQGIKEFFGAEPSDNIYESEAGQEILNKKGAISQNNLFDSERSKNDGGLRYAKESSRLDDIAQSALNFANADISAIEVSYDVAHFDGGALFQTSSKDGKLNEHEIASYSPNYDTYLGNLKDVDIDGDEKTFSAQEYASYLMVADGLQKDEDGNISFDMERIDGTISADEADIAKHVRDDELKGQAEKIYSKYFEE